ncbi:HlyD family type I secretion periplasmic adaptor subunit [Halodesulfovibrio sp.]|jgi:hemolysin D|uniref:HlyD family type I secretion periplasmic adaptor subunit n=1 Tax=Halodesulfovibrio sp. TaxID=1912772 RepID=UPI0025D2EE1A|nr:HlyD family type I secretion periplasmic adaptor subunit [Halodesulfovibrio sp.]MCT4627901.1 HlyD family type I secretion periplasmic adaptor subunit [Halodesulfovibrio sp.]
MHNFPFSLFKKSNSKSDLDFLPAALEVIETPASPIGRALLWTIMLCVCFITCWACIGKTNVVAVAVGKVIPVDQVKTINLLEDGVIKRIFVKEGQIVEKGTPLIEIDSTLAQLDIETLGQDQLNLQFELAKAQCLLKWISDLKKKPAFIPPQNTAASTSKLIEIYANQTKKEANSLRFQLKRLTSRKEKLIAQHKAEEHRLAKLEQTLSIATKWSKTMKTLYSQGLGSEYDWLQKEQQRIINYEDLNSCMQKLKEITASLQEVAAQRKQLVTDFTKNLLATETAILSKIDDISTQTQKAEKIKTFQSITAPVSGKIQQLAVHTVGGVILSGAPIMIIVPSNPKLEIEAFINNSDIGFVHEGQSAEIKLEAFPYNEFGTLHGEVRSISENAIEEPNKGFRYATRIKLNKKYLTAGSKKLKLMPGMVATAEVNLRERRLIQYFLSPLLKYKHESFKEK